MVFIKYNTGPAPAPYLTKNPNQTVGLIGVFCCYQLMINTGVHQSVVQKNT